MRVIVMVPGAAVDRNFDLLDEAQGFAEPVAIFHQVASETNKVGGGFIDGIDDPLRIGAIALVMKVAEMKQADLSVRIGLQGTNAYMDGFDPAGLEEETARYGERGHFQKTS